ncbi:MAG: hypothetical protein JST21_00885 [Bacteroidetes bacterium]|nr:hypothetical protein [Bacteroidota bacterium]
MFHISRIPKIFQAKYLAPSLLLAIGNDITKKIGAGYNAGVEWDGFPTIPARLYSVSFNFDLGSKWDSYVAIDGSDLINFFPKHDINGGFGYFINNNKKLDIFSGFEISNAAPEYFFGILFSFRVK